MEIVRQLLARGAWIHAFDKEGRTAFFYTNSYERASQDAEILKLLIEKGADVNAATTLGFTALMRAVEMSTREIVQSLLDRGAAVNARDKQGNTPLLAGLTQHYYQPDIVRLLVDRGADVNAARSDGLTPLLAAGEPDFIRILIAHGADINALTRSGKDVLSQNTCNAAALRVLLEKGARLNPKAANVYASFSCGFRPCVDCARLFMERGASISTPGPNGETPLMILAGMNDLPLMQEFLKRGPDIMARDNQGNTALHRAGYPEFAELFLARGADVNARTADGKTPLMATTNSKVAEVLIRSGAVVNARAADGSTALIVNRSPEMTQILLEHGAEVNLQNSAGVSALIAAVEREDPFSVKMLLARGADVNAITKSGNTAMKVATQKSNFSMAAILRQAGAK
jgi:ankyrin repeat protein